jgi:hypothetical protein
VSCAAAASPSLKPGFAYVASDSQCRLLLEEAAALYRELHAKACKSGKLKCTTTLPPNPPSAHTFAHMEECATQHPEGQQPPFFKELALSLSLDQRLPQNITDPRARTIAAQTFYVSPRRNSKQAQV